MTKDTFDNKEVISVDLNEATLAVKESRFKAPCREISLNDHPDNIDCLYLAAVSSRFKKFDKSTVFRKLLTIAPDMGRAYQTGHFK